MVFALSFPPISNLSVISKLLKRLVARRLLRYLTDNNLLPRSSFCVLAEPFYPDCGCKYKVVKYASICIAHIR